MNSEERAVRRTRAEDAAAVWPLVRDFAVSYEPEARIFEHSFTDLLSRPDTLVGLADEGSSVIGYLNFRKTLAPAGTGGLTLRNPAPWAAPGTSRAGTRRCYPASMAHLETDFPKRIGAPATRALVGAGYNRLNQLAGVPVTELKKLHGMGPKALRVLQEALEEEGQSLG